MNRYLTCWQLPVDSSHRSNSRSGRAIACLARCHRIGAIVLLSCLTVGLVTLPISSQETNDGTDETEPAAVQADQSNIRPTLRLGSQGEAVAELQAILKLLGYYAGTVDGTYQESTATAVSAFQQAAGLQPDGIAGAETWNRLLPAAPTITPSTATAPTTPTAPIAPNPAAPAPTLAPAPSPSNFPSPAPSPAASPTLSPAPSASATPRSGAATPTPTPTPVPTAALPADQPILRLGMTGTAVTQLQERLKAIGLFNGAVDGVFGVETEIAVQEVQRRYNLEPDGIVGPATWAVLLGN